jgi:hypothetical protein
MNVDHVRIVRRTALGLGLLLIGGTSVLAHHGWSGYSDAQFSLTGVVETVDLGQPHGHLMVRADGGVWDVVLGPPARNRRAGITDGVIQIGATVTAYGKRHLDPSRLEMKTERLQVGDKVYAIYPERL